MFLQLTRSLTAPELLHMFNGSYLLYNWDLDTDSLHKRLKGSCPISKNPLFTTTLMSLAELG